MAEKTQEHKKSDAAHHAAREALRESEVKYRSLFENSPDAIMTLDPVSGNFTSCNPATLKVFGVGTFDKFVSGGPINLSPERQPDGRLSAEKAREMIATAMRAESHSFEWTHRRLNGEEFFADVQLIRVDQDGKATILATVKDITARKRAEQAVQESEERYRRLFETETDAILLVDRETGRFMDANPSALKLYGYSRQEFLSLKHTDVSAEPEKTSQAIAAGLRFVANRRHRKKDGTIFPVEICGNYFDLKGRKMHVAAIRDLTVQRQAEETLLKSEAELNRAQAIAHVGSWSWDCQSGLVSWSAEMYRIYGVTPETFDHTFNGLTRLIHPDDLPRQIKAHEAVAQGRASDPFEYRVIRPDGSIRVVQVFAAEIEQNAAGQPIRVFGAAQDITERKLGEQALQMREEQLRLYAEHSPLAVAMLDRDMKYLVVSRRWMEDFRLGNQSLIGRSHYEVFPEIPPRWMEVHKRCLAGAAEKCDEDHFLRADGRTDWIRWEIRPWHLADNLVGGIIIFSENITERKRAAEALRESESKLRAVFECSRDAIGIALKGIHVFANPAYLKMFGVGHQQIVGTSILSHIAPSHRPQMLQNIERRAAGENAPISYETRGLKADGVEFDMEVAVSTYQLQGEIYTIANIRDITERKRIEASHARLATVVEQAAETIVITDPGGTILYANPAFEKTTGYTRAEAVGQNPRLLKSGRQGDEFYRQMWETLERGEVWHGHFINRRKGGTLYEEDATISPVRDDAGKVISYVAVKRDVTREAQLERQFLQSQKMESVGQLAGGVAHDFNNMLAATMMHLGLLQGHEEFDTETQETIKELIEEARRSSNLTRQLLMFSRRSVMEVKLLDLNELLTNLLKMLGRLIGEHIVVRFDRREGLPAIEADPGMIEQVIMNLAVNARDAMPGGGKLAIDIEAVQVDAERVEGKPDVRPGQFLCLSLSDTGCGMDEATRDRIFEPFFTTKEAGKGTGLGLATVDGIVAQHKGWVEVESAVGKGATFRVFLPASAKKTAGATQTAKPAALRGHETILVVEDDASVRRLVALNLRKLGYAVFEVENGQAAMNMWQQRRGEFDLLFSDMVMPEGLTGLDLAEKLKKEKPSLKVIISSGYSAEISGQSRLDAHGIIYFQKPYSVDTLAKVVRDCLDTP